MFQVSFAFKSEVMMVEVLWKFCYEIYIKMLASYNYAPASKTSSAMIKPQTVKRVPIVKPEN